MGMSPPAAQRGCEIRDRGGGFIGKGVEPLLTEEVSTFKEYSGSLEGAYAHFGIREHLRNI
jgi:hypothetical protein